MAERLPPGLLSKIIAQLNPRHVILFGSPATGKTHRDSDWDLLVVVDDETPAERINWRAMHEAVAAFVARWISFHVASRHFTTASTLLARYPGLQQLRASPSMNEPMKVDRHLGMRRRVACLR